ncbi:MAG: hypothetical protein QOF53_3200 [Nocardioidaceae bacterium]|nr:hypothetical protein [Nocardioidaceae bacterium]
MLALVPQPRTAYREEDHGRDAQPQADDARRADDGEKRGRERGPALQPDQTEDDEAGVQQTPGRRVIPRRRLSAGRR